ncbi:MAG: hypothetical protein OXB84_04170, partial [Halobacteriovoraceae bacterium]|nr:hypothetical protein [Halobacteriovoraceae bacterium]
MEISFLPYILILISFILISSLCLFIPRYGKISSYGIAISGLLIFISIINQIPQTGLGNIFVLSTDKIMFIQLLGVFNIFAIILNGYSNIKKICNSLCVNLAYVGSIFFIGVTEFTGFYISMELLNIIICSLIAFSDTNLAKKTAVRFYIQNLVISGLFLLGLAFFYGSTGGLEFFDFNIQNHTLYTLSVVFLLIVGLFKIGLFPF